MDLNRWLDDHRLVVCVGSGGVGKTTTAASVALWAAVRGRKVMVLTIDPAKRLANSLGLDAIRGEGARIDLSGISGASGDLWAMMLDSRSTWDDIIARVAPSAEVRDRILGNLVYRYIADSFAGSQDYMATEKIYDLASSGDYDLVVLDTPPVKNALDFLESPGRVVSFFDEKVYGWFVNTYDKNSVFGGRLRMGTSALMWRLLSFVLGQEFLDDLAQFFKDFQALYEGFRERHDAVIAMLHDGGTSFLTVCAPTDASIEVAEFFQEELVSHDLNAAGIVVNQVHRCEGQTHDATVHLGSAVEALGADLDESVRASVLARLGMAHRRLGALARVEQVLAQRVHEALVPGAFYQEVPRLDGEVHDLSSLLQVGQQLFDRPALYVRDAEVS